jgi:hypothetical protein
MANIDKNNLGYLGDYQLRLVAQILIENLVN